MSLLIKTPHKTKLKLATQKRKLAVLSVLASLLTVLLIGLVLLNMLLPAVDSFAPEIVSYQGAQEKEQKTPKKIRHSVQQKPSAPSANLASVIVIETSSELAIPESNQFIDISMDMGAGDDFGDGFENGGDWGQGGGATFFGQKVTAKRIVYVVDYSASMRGKRIKLLKKELRDSLNKMVAGTQYQLIFFAGPTWLAGDEVEMSADRSSAKVISEAGEFEWLNPRRNPHSWGSHGAKQVANWLVADMEQLDLSLKAVRKTSLIWGTAWREPLEMALRMKPKPDVVFFMTDGMAGKSSKEIAEVIGKRAKKMKIKLNTIAMMDPRAGDAMEVMAKASGGKFVMINERGEVEGR